MRRLEEAIEIDAPPETVWAVLTDFAAYPQWNPFILSIEGLPAVGERLVVNMKPPGGFAMTFKPTVLEADAPRSFRWLGKLGVSGVFDGEHRFEVQPIGEGRSRFVQSEVFKGILVPVLGMMFSKTAEGFRTMNEALKQRAEVRVT